MKTMKYYEFHKFAQSGEKICMNESVFNHGQDDHNHDFIEITYITKGSGLYTENGNKSNVEEGDLLMVSTNDIHSFTPLTRDFSMTNCIFLPEVLSPDLPRNCTVSDILNHNIFSVYRLSEIKINTVVHLHCRAVDFQHLMRDMCYEYFNKKYGYNAVLKNHLISLLIKIIRPCMQQYINHPYFTRDELIALVAGYFKRSNCFTKIRLESLAEQIHVTPKYFSALFKRKVGITLSDFVKSIRLERAADRLAKSSSNILSIMQYVGYNDSKYFYKEFKKKYNCTPSEYRKQFQNNRQM